jgi:hypothetical protein
MLSPADVLDHHIKCFGEGGLEGILSDYAPDAVLFTPDGQRRRWRQDLQGAPRRPAAEDAEA